MSNAFVYVNAPDDTSRQTPLEAEMFAHPRVPGEFWESIGWDQQQAANLAADIERGAYQRKGWFGTGNPDKAA
jgi:hypothetical protein